MLSYDLLKDYFKKQSKPFPAQPSLFIAVKTVCIRYNQNYTLAIVPH